jgi:hypothetical protein
MPFWRWTGVERPPQHPELRVRIGYDGDERMSLGE